MKPHTPRRAEKLVLVGVVVFVLFLAGIGPSGYELAQENSARNSPIEPTGDWNPNLPRNEPYGLVTGPSKVGRARVSGTTVVYRELVSGVWWEAIFDLATNKISYRRPAGIKPIASDGFVWDGTGYDGTQAALRAEGGNLPPNGEAEDASGLAADGRADAGQKSVQKETDAAHSQVRIERALAAPDGSNHLFTGWTRVVHARGSKAWPVEPAEHLDTRFETRRWERAERNREEARGDLKASINEETGRAPHGVTTLAVQNLETNLIKQVAFYPPGYRVKDLSLRKIKTSEYLLAWTLEKPDGDTDIFVARLTPDYSRSTMRASRSVVLDGSEFSYLITPTNNGVVADAGLVVQERLDNTFNDRSFSHEPEPDGRTRTYSLGRLAAGEQRTLRIDTFASHRDGHSTRRFIIGSGAAWRTELSTRGPGVLPLADEEDEDIPVEPGPANTPAPPERPGKTPGKLTVATYNISNKRVVKKEGLIVKTICDAPDERMSQVADLIRRTGADIVALQEVSGQNAWKLRAKLAGEYEYMRWGKTFPIVEPAPYGLKDKTLFQARGEDAWMGNMLISRYNIVQSENYVLSEHPLESRGLLRARVRLDTGDVEVFTTHLDTDGQIEQARKLVNYVDQFGPPRVVLGDFNSGPMPPAENPRPFELDTFELLNERYKKPYHLEVSRQDFAGGERRYLDHVFSNDLQFGNAGSYTWTYTEEFKGRTFWCPSDHKPVRVSFQLPPPGIVSRQEARLVLEPGETMYRLAHVDESTLQAHFSIRGSDAELTLVRPEGQEVVPTDSQANVLYQKHTAHTQYIIDNPDPGWWQLIMRADTDAVSPMVAVSVGLAKGKLVDITPPVTTLKTIPEEPDGNEGWYTSRPFAVLSATDYHPNSSGVDATYFRLGTGRPVRYNVPIMPKEGRHVIAYYSIDGAQNSEFASDYELAVDLGAPSAPVVKAVTPDRNQVRLRWGASSDAVSGVAGYHIFDAKTQRLLGRTSKTHYALRESITGSRTYFVRSLDIAGNYSEPSNTAVATR